MEQSPRISQENFDENSLGILSLDNLKVFGELSSMSNSVNGTVNTRRVSDRLNAERLKALETLEKPRRSQARQTTAQAGPLVRTSTLFEQPDPMSRRQKASESINISDLITDETINLNSSGCSVSNTLATPRDNKISFEPAEITGRSTLYNNVFKTHDSETRLSTTSNQSKRDFTVSEILATSFAEKARKLSEKVMAPNVGDDDDGHNGFPHTYSESTFDSFSNSRSLPCTADLSHSTISNTLGNGGKNFLFSMDVGQQQFDESNFSSAAEFAPAELMESKMIMDEISWAEEYAAIPTATLSNQAKEKIAAPKTKEDIETSVTNSMIAGDPNFSVGSFFKKRSDSLIQFVSADRPDKYRMPSSLVDNDSGEEVVREGIRYVDSSVTPLNDNTTPKPDNKTYTKIMSNTKENAKMLTKQALENRLQQSDLFFEATKNKLASNEMKDDNSYLLSLTAIDRVLRNMDLDSDTSATEVINKIVDYKRESIQNKENIEPPTNNKTDTMDFSESILNSSDFRQLHQSISAPRTPLSPLMDVTAQPPELIITQSNSIDHDADIDEWPSTPIKPPNRQIRRTKSPNAINPANETLKPDDISPMNKNQISLNPSNMKTPSQPKSLSSTRLDGFEPPVLTSTGCGCVLSPNQSKNTSNNLIQSSVRRDQISPFSSPSSCLSPSSPLLDSTTNSERRLLQIPACVRKVNTSPATSETSGNSVPAMRKGRSNSRCSNSSEFSHRDGKTIPLKVTQLQLCWGSTKLRTDVRKTMQVKNTSNKRLAVRIGIHGPGFQLVNSESNTLTLQSQECRTIAINFCPTVSGAAVGMLSFYSPLDTNNSNISLLDIPLYGYGGYANIMVHGLLKGPVGSSFLPMGDVCELPSGALMTQFTIYNKGPLTAFANITVDSTIHMKPRLSDAFEVQPSKVIIPAGNEVLVDITFKPNRDDIKNIVKKNKHVVTLANLRVICGDEPNRQRMRSLMQRMTSEERTKLTSSMLDNLWCTFPQEPQLRDLSRLKELPEFLMDLITALRIHEVSLTLNRDFDESDEASSIFFPEADETVLFRTICMASSPTSTHGNLLDPVDELLELDTTVVPNGVGDGSWSVKPLAVTFSVNNLEINAASLIIKNFYKSQQYCEIACSIPNLLRFTPSDGYAAPDGGQLEVVVHAVPERIHDALKKKVFIMVRMENESINVPVNFNK